YLKRDQERERRYRRREGDATSTATTPADAPGNLDGLVKQTRQPGFISLSYFLRFKFDEGHYALVGRERLEDRDVLRIEYYPTKLFTEENRRAEQAERGAARRGVPESDAAYGNQVMRLMNKTSKVTLWIE